MPFISHEWSPTKGSVNILLLLNPWTYQNRHNLVLPQKVGLAHPSNLHLYKVLARELRGSVFLPQAILIDNNKTNTDFPCLACLDKAHGKTVLKPNALHTESLLFRPYHLKFEGSQSRGRS